MRATALALACLTLALPVAAQELDVPFRIAEDAQAAGCASSIVAGLDPNGDGFLAVRTGPGTGYRKIDQLYNGDMVRTCARSGAWIGVHYGKPRRVGWVHGRWLVDGAG